MDTYKYPEYPSMEYVNGLSDAQKEELVADMDKRRAHAMDARERHRGGTTSLCLGTIQSATPDLMRSKAYL